MAARVTQFHQHRPDQIHVTCHFDVLESRKIGVQSTYRRFFCDAPTQESPVNPAETGRLTPISPFANSLRAYNQS
jgi:hypothetical protein